MIGEGPGFEIAQGRLGKGARIHHCCGRSAVGVAEAGIELMASGAATKRIALRQEAWPTTNHPRAHRGKFAPIEIEPGTTAGPARRVLWSGHRAAQKDRRLAGIAEIKVRRARGRGPRRPSSGRSERKRE